MQIHVTNLFDPVMPFVRYDKQSGGDVVSAIARNTSQTWQPDRTEQETVLNTKQGKTAEDIFEEFVRKSLHGIGILSYDVIRNDHYTKNAPFDFIIWHDDSKANINRVVDAVRRDIDRSPSINVVISCETRDLIKREGIKIVEVKSTKIAERHKPALFNGIRDYKNGFWVKEIAKRILRDDFLAYPSKCRKTPSRFFTMNDYARILKAEGVDVGDSDDIRRFETEQQICDTFVRIYLDETAMVAFLVGWIDKNSFYQNADIKKMPQKDKSELALYFAVPLTQRLFFDDLEKYIKC